MMPTSPRSPLSFRTAGFPQYGWKAGSPSGTFPDHQRLKPTPGVRRSVCIRPSCTSWSERMSRTVSGRRLDCAPPWRVINPPPQGSSPGFELCCLGPSSLNRPHPSHSQAHCDFAAWRLIRDAFAVRERIGDPRAVPGFRCSFRPDMPPSLTSGSSIIVSVQNTDVDIGLRYGPKGSALPIIPQSVSRGARFSRLRWFATATACQVAGPPVRI
jgi:hypothetical protein